MKRRFLARSVLALTMAAVSLIGGARQGIAGSPDPAHGAVEVRVEVATLRNSNGHVLCTLFDSEDAYRQLHPTLQLTVEATRPVTTCVFHEVTPGIYMISAIHDENDNGKLDKNFLGMPKEGYGVSNNHTYATKGPVFKESAVEIGDRRKAIAIQLRYPGG
jgi:uncharacterized protein (DUF2141 family)